MNRTHLCIIIHVASKLIIMNLFSLSIVTPKAHAVDCSWMGKMLFLFLAQAVFPRKKKKNCACTWDKSRQRQEKRDAPVLIWWSILQLRQLKTVYDFYFTTFDAKSNEMSNRRQIQIPFNHIMWWKTNDNFTKYTTKICWNLFRLHFKSGHRLASLLSRRPLNGHFKNAFNSIYQFVK